MKRLFALKKQNGSLVHGTDAKKGPLFFDNKKEAKKWRDEFNRVEYVRNPVCVTAGPDHRNYKG